MSTIVDADVQGIVDGLTVPYDELAGACVLVTGATGMIGQYLVRSLLEISDRLSQPLRVVAQARDAEKARHRFADTDARSLEIICGDVSSVAALPKRRVSHMIHAASPASPDRFQVDPIGVVQANALGTLVLLDRAHRDGAYFALVSTMEVYGRPCAPSLGDDVVLTEGDLGLLDSMDLRSVYPESKRVAENLCVAYASQYGVRSDIIRLSHTYGPGMDLADSRVQAQFFRSALAGEDIVLASDGSMRRSYTYVADAASAVLYVLLTAPLRDQTSAFNVADNASRTSIRELAEKILEAAGQRTDSLLFGAVDPNSKLWSKMRGGTYLDCTRLEALGWVAQHQLVDGTARTVAHHRELNPDF